MRYVALGDSYTIGTAVPRCRRVPRAASPVPPGGLELVANLGVNGYTTADLIRDELPALNGLAPEFVTLLIGVNDVVQGVLAATYEANVNILDACRRGCRRTASYRRDPGLHGDASRRRLRRPRRPARRHRRRQRDHGPARRGRGSPSSTSSTCRAGRRGSLARCRTTAFTRAVASTPVGRADRAGRRGPCIPGLRRAII